MNQFIGTKLVVAERMTRLQYNNIREWKLPEDEDGADMGFLVVNKEGDCNTKDYVGYVSWVPDYMFVLEYLPTTRMTFGNALIMLKAGKKVARKYWNGKGMWLVLVPGTEDVEFTPGTVYHKAGVTEKSQILPHIDMYTVDSTGRRAMLPGWLASQTDMLSNDWCIID